MNRVALKFGVAAVAALTLASASVAQDASGVPKIQLSLETWDFGTAWQGEPLKQDIEIKNVGTAPLKILDVHTSCGCTTPTKPKPELAPGESDTMSISYSSAKRPGAANQTVTLQTNDPERLSITLRVQGTVKPVYELGPRDGLIFGRLFENSQEQRVVEITNSYKEPLFLKLDASVDPAPFKVELKEIEPGQKYELRARTEPPIPVGRHQSHIRLITSIGLLPSIESTIYGFVQPPVTVRPAKLYWPRSYPTEMKRILRVSHAPDRNVKVTAARANHPSIDVKVEEVKAATAKPEGIEEEVSAYKIIVTLPPGSRLPAGVEPEIEILTDATDSEYARLVVPVQVIGLAKPAAAGTPPDPAAGTPEAGGREE